jgi:hypothetical protein
MDFIDYYKVLGIEKDATEDRRDIEDHIKKLARIADSLDSTEVVHAGRGIAPGTCGYQGTVGTDGAGACLKCLEGPGLGT